jgi:hypothetical protein
MHDRPITRLRSLHQRLERQIDHERGLRSADGFRIARLKKLKLAIKDRLARAAISRPRSA